MTTPINILLIEDNQIAKTTSALILKHLGYRVTVGISGKEALELFKPDFYALIYVDLGLPDVDGCELVTKLRELDQASQEKTTMIVLTAHADKAIENACFQAGADAILEKPLLVKTALQTIEKFVHYDDVEVEDLKLPPALHSGLDK